jgi:hypothetical protein
MSNVSEGGAIPDTVHIAGRSDHRPKKLKAMRKWPAPKDKHELKKFLGLCTYNRRFIGGSVDITKPLTQFT